ncbi:MAG: hypothetical protein HYV53_02145 [Parcubacteria group bacterium]|nr:hypothetical protein [Parcubacteria group bacterium]
MKDILEMDKAELLTLNPYDFAYRILGAAELIHMAETLGAFWRYNYEAAKSGKPGKHALLKSGLHSDGFLTSKILLEPDNIRLGLAFQLRLRFAIRGIGWPDYLAGIPDGATKLAQDLGGIAGVKVAEMKKDKSDGRITVMTQLPIGSKLLIIEDFCTKGTGFKETVLEIKSKYPEAEVLPYELVIVNRGGLRKIMVDGIGNFTIIPITNYRINEWEPDPEKCPLCQLGSVAIKPKVSEESWRELTTSQL